MLHNIASQLYYELIGLLIVLFWLIELWKPSKNVIVCFHIQVPIITQVDVSGLGIASRTQVFNAGIWDWNFANLGIPVGLRRDNLWDSCRCSTQHRSVPRPFNYSTDRLTSYNNSTFALCITMLIFAIRKTIKSNKRSKNDNILMLC